jgi:hypothetical protein
MVHVRGTYMDQGDFGTLLNKEKCGWKQSSPAAPSARFFNNTWFQDRGGLLLQHSARPCEDYLVNPEGSVLHFPSSKSGSLGGLWLRTRHNVTVVVAIAERYRVGRENIDERATCVG